MDGDASSSPVSHLSATKTNAGEDAESSSTPRVEILRRYWRCWKRALFENTEETGIERYDPERRRGQPRPTVLAILGFWFTLNLSTVNMTVGMLGPRRFSLPLHEVMIVASVAVTCGCIPVGLVACLGPRSGLRTMVINRFIVGWYLAKLVSLLNVLMVMGYTILDVIAAGNIMSALMPDVPVASTLAVVLLGILALAIATIGSAALHFLERWAWRPQLIAIAILIGATVPHLTEEDIVYATTESPGNRQIGLSNWFLQPRLLFHRHLQLYCCGLLRALP